MRPTFFTSDHHFGHENIIAHCKRPFRSVEEMNEAMIRRWNQTVPPNGRVFHLGDLSWIRDSLSLNAILSRLNFHHMVIIPGNHDKSVTWLDHLNRFVTALKGPITLPLNGVVYCLSHEPENTNLWCQAIDGEDGFGWDVNLCGHVHEKWLTSVSPFGKLSFNVGVDQHGFRPWRLSEIEKRIRNTKKKGML